MERSLEINPVESVKISKAQARAIILHAAGLSKRAQFGKGIKGTYRFIDHLGFLQIDTNYVVERAHHHAIACRVPDYQTQWLEQLQLEGKIFEGWTYASGFIPMNEYRFTLPIKASLKARRKPLTLPEVNLMNQILDRVAREGPLMARDFENDRQTKSSGWWDWRPSKLALERLHLEGRLMTLRTKGFAKVYDLTENVLPASIDLSVPTSEEFARFIIMRSLRALGVAEAKDIAMRARYVKNNQVRSELQAMVAEGKVCAVRMNRSARVYYTLPEYIQKNTEVTGDAFILSPFDTMNVYRKRLMEFFDFDYMVECFVPEAKRKFGYFALPVLVGDRFVARMDAKADRKNGMLIIHQLHFEPGKIPNADLTKIGEAIHHFAHFNQCSHVKLVKSNGKTQWAKIRQVFD